MKDFNEIGKHLPYRETDQQVDAMLEHITQYTLQGGAKSRRKKALVQRLTFITSAAAAIAIFASVAINSFINKPSTYDAVMNSESIAEVLNQMGDEAVESEVFYAQIAMPEYYY